MLLSVRLLGVVGLLCLPSLMYLFCVSSSLLCFRKGPTSRPPPPTLPPPPPPPLLPQTLPPQVKPPPPTLPPPPNFNSYNGQAADNNKHQSEAKDYQNEAKGNGNEARDIESEASVNESEANSDRSGDTDGGGTSDSVSTPETVILG